MPTTVVDGNDVLAVRAAMDRAAERFDDDGRLVDDQLREELSEALGALAAEMSPRLVAA